MTIGAGDIDAGDDKVHIRFVFAPVLENANHSTAQQPYYFIQLTNVTRARILYTNFASAPEAGSGRPPWKSMTASISGADTEIDYMDWQLVDIAPGIPAINVGDRGQASDHRVRLPAGRPCRVRPGRRPRLLAKFLSSTRRGQSRPPNTRRRTPRVTA